MRFFNKVMIKYCVIPISIFLLTGCNENIEMPKKKTKLNPLSKEDKLENKNKSSKRIPIEHINAKIKTFKIVAHKYRNRRKRFGLRFNLICALINFDRGFNVGKSHEK